MLKVTVDRADEERTIGAIRKVVGTSLFYEVEEDDECVTYTFSGLPEAKAVEIENALNLIDNARFAWT